MIIRHWMYSGAWTPDTETCTFMGPTNSLSNVTTSFNQILEILKEETFYSDAFVLIVCPDSKSENISIVTFAQYDWAKFFTLPDSFLDVYIYTNILENLLDAANYTSEWIGSIPSKPSSYEDVNDMNVIWIHRMLSDTTLIEDEIDVLVFDKTRRKQTNQDTKINPLWINLTDIALESIGEDPTDASTLIDYITQHNNTFHDMSFVARPMLIRQFAHWIRTVIEYYRLDSRVLLMLQTAPCHEMKRSIQLYISNILIPYFFITKASQIMTISDYKKSERSAIYRENDEISSELHDNIKEILSSENSVIEQLYVLCHSKDSCNQASEEFIYYSWGKHLYYMPKTNILEAYFHTNVLEELMQSSTHNPYWVGSISWKAMTKTYVHVIDKMLADKTLVQDGYDVLGFWTPPSFDPHYCNSTMFLHSNRVHVGLMGFIEYILNGIDESSDNISLLRQPYPTFKSFYGSYFVARPVFMQEYITWIRKVMVFIAKDPLARVYVWSDSHYKGDAADVYGVGFYPLHAFVVERLLQYFFNSRNASIALLFEYMEKVNIATGDYYYYYPCPK